jgi:PPM family protein phosphatase
MNAIDPPQTVPVPATIPEAPLTQRSLLSTEPRRVGAGSDVGRARERNEDATFVLTQERLASDGPQSVAILAVADGMGGQAGGDRASLAAVQGAAEYLVREVVAPFVGPENGRRVPLSEALGEAFRRGQRQVLTQVAGAATTLTIVLLMGRRVHVGHVGDCRAYLWRAGCLRQLTRDHSVLARLRDLGRIDPEDKAPGDPRRNFLYRAIGQPGDLDVDLFSGTLEPEDGLLLCSDGLWGCLTNGEMAEIIGHSAAPTEACRRLIDTANARGGPDNISVILLHPVG